MQGSAISPAPCKTKTEKAMEKKFYEMPEVEVIDLMLEGQILSASDPDEETGEAPKSDTEI